MRVALALGAVPLLAVSIAVALIFGPGRIGPHTGIKVWGHPVEGSDVVVLRLEALRALEGLVEPAQLDGLDVDLPGEPAKPWTGSTGPDGSAEARIQADRAFVGTTALRVRQGRDELLRGTLHFEIAKTPPRRSRDLPGAVRGQPEPIVRLLDGALVSPFPGRIQVLVPSATEGSVELRSDALAGGPLRAALDDGGAELRVTPTALHVPAEVQFIPAPAMPEISRWSGVLPVHPGGLWLDPAHSGTTFAIASPVAREVGYFSVMSDRGRIDGGRIRLVEDGGFSRGTFDIEPLPDDATWAVLVLSPEPLEQSAATTTWTLRDQDGPADAAIESPRLSLLWDGMPEAKSREHARAWLARRSALFVLGMAALLEIGLLVVRSRRAQRALDRHLAALGPTDDGTPREPRRLFGVHPLTVVLFALLVLFGFSIVGALAWFV